jgi:hypothetical protein
VELGAPPSVIAGGSALDQAEIRDLSRGVADLGQQAEPVAT